MLIERLNRQLMVITENRKGAVLGFAMCASRARVVLYRCSLVKACRWTLFFSVDDAYSCVWRTGRATSFAKTWKGDDMLTDLYF